MSVGFFRKICRMYCAVALIMLRGILKDCGEPKDVEVDKIVSRRALLKKTKWIM